MGEISNRCGDCGVLVVGDEVGDGGNVVELYLCDVVEICYRVGFVDNVLGIGDVGVWIVVVLIVFKVYGVYYFVKDL